MRTLQAYAIRHAWQILFVAVALVCAFVGSEYHPALGLGAAHGPTFIKLAFAPTALTTSISPC